MVFQETNLTKEVYTWEASGFCVIETEVPRAHRGSVAVFYRGVEHFAVEELRPHGPNVITSQLVTGRRRWHVVGCYIVSRYASTIEDVNVAIIV